MPTRIIGVYIISKKSDDSIFLDFTFSVEIIKMMIGEQSLASVRKSPNMHLMEHVQ